VAITVDYTTNCMAAAWPRSVTIMRRRWNPAAPRADEAAHDRAVACEMARLGGAPAE